MVGGAASLGASPPAVMVVSSPEEGAWLVQTFADIDAQRAGRGLPAMVLVDLRAP
jgi:hypothetical protein